MKRTVFMLAGALLLLIATAQGNQQRRFVRTADRATGIVLDPGPGGRHAAIRFHLADGTPVRMQSQGLFGAVHPGQAVPVLFSPGDPERTAQVGWFGPLFGFCVGLAVMGAALVLLALLTGG